MRKRLSAVYETAALPTELRWHFRAQDAGIRKQHSHQNLLPIQRYIILSISILSTILGRKRIGETERHTGIRRDACSVELNVGHRMQELGNSVMTNPYFLSRVILY